MKYISSDSVPRPVVYLHPPHRRQSRALWSAPQPPNLLLQSFMLNRQIQSYSEDAHSLQPAKSNQNLNQYNGSQDSGRILLDVPSETLTGITSYLDPPSLLALSRVNTHLYEHVKNDNTWHRAFVCQFLQIGPESDINDSVKSLMLRRSESSWRNEVIARYNLRRCVVIDNLIFYNVFKRPTGVGKNLAIPR